MFTRDEAKEFITKLGKRWFFPDFNNKLSWIAVIAGVGVVTAPSIGLVVANWAVDLWNAYAAATLSLPKLDSEVGASVGVALVGLGLSHNLAVKGLATWSDAIDYKKKMDAYRQDKCLMDQFLKDLPSNAPEVIFLRDQDFGSSFWYEHLTSLERFLHKWQGAESRFISHDFEAARASFYSALQAFMLEISSVCGPVGNSTTRFTVIPDHVRDEFSWPEHVTKSVEQLNARASEAFKRHQELILLGRGLTLEAT